MSDESKAKAEALARRLAIESISSLRANYGIVFDDAEDTEAISREFAPVLEKLYEALDEAKELIGSAYRPCFASQIDATAWMGRAKQALALFDQPDSTEVKP